VKRLAIPWGLVALLLVLLVSTWDYRIELERENDRLNAKVARLIEPPNFMPPVQCNWISQRIDRRRKDGTIWKSTWKRKPVCVTT